MPLLAVAQPPMDMERMLHQVCITITTITIIIAIALSFAISITNTFVTLKSLGLSRRQTTSHRDQRLKHTSMNGGHLALVLKVTQHHEMFR